MGEVPRKRGRPRSEKPVEINEIEQQQAVIDFYEKRLDEAYAFLGALLENDGRRPRA